MRGRGTTGEGSLYSETSHWSSRTVAVQPLLLVGPEVLGAVALMWTVLAFEVIDIVMIITIVILGCIF